MILINLSMRRMVTMVMMSVKMRTVMIILIKIIMRMMVTLLAMIYQMNFLPRRDCRIGNADQADDDFDPTGVVDHH